MRFQKLNAEEYHANETNITRQRVSRRAGEQ